LTPYGKVGLKQGEKLGSKKASVFWMDCWERSAEKRSWAKQKFRTNIT